MPASVHKILIHGSSIGQLSEEAQESKNKDMRNFRQHHTRKCSRVKTNEDLLLRLLLSSDPLISSLRKLPAVNRSKLSPDVISLLNAPKCTYGIIEQKEDDADSINCASDFSDDETDDEYNDS